MIAEYYCWDCMAEVESESYDDHADHDIQDVAADEGEPIASTRGEWIR